MDKKLPFLDILITRANHTFTTSVCHKPTNTGLYTNSNSFIPLVYKKSLIYTLLHRYYNICSTLPLILKIVMFLLNNYPVSFINTCVNAFLDKIRSPSPKISLAPKKRCFSVSPLLDKVALKSVLEFIHLLCDEVAGSNEMLNLG